MEALKRQVNIAVIECNSKMLYASILKKGNTRADLNDKCKRKNMNWINITESQT